MAEAIVELKGVGKSFRSADGSARSVLEGCAYALRDIVDRLDALGLGHGEVRIVGGGARDDLWASIKANR